MNSMLDYIEWRGDLGFDEAPVNDIDLLIFSELVHAPLEMLEPEDMGKTLGALAEKLFPVALTREDGMLAVPRYTIWNGMKRKRRFAEVRITKFSSEFVPTEDKQFAAAVFEAAGNGIVAYRGTDSTLVGWKEDFNLCVSDRIASHEIAVRFLEEAAILYPSLTVCGHSKGGHIALYTPAVCSSETRRKIQRIVAFDAPGVSDRVRSSNGWAEIRDRIHGYIPESSIIGMLFSGVPDPVIVRSDSSGIMQHNPFYWHVHGTDLVTCAENTALSRIVAGTVDNFLRECTPDERSRVVNTVFDILNKTEAKNFGEFMQSLKTHWTSVGFALLSVPKEDAKLVGRLLLVLLEACKDSIISQTHIFPALSDTGSTKKSIE